MDEVHTKLVDIMQDRLLVAAKQLVVEAESWGKGPPPPQMTTAGGTEGVGDAVRSLSKQMGTLRTVLTPILQEEEVSGAVGQVLGPFTQTAA
jgi:hypothetical protein